MILGSIEVASSWDYLSQNQIIIYEVLELANGELAAAQAFDVLQIQAMSLWVLLQNAATIREGIGGGGINLLSFVVGLFIAVMSGVAAMECVESPWLTGGVHRFLSSPVSSFPAAASSKSAELKEAFRASLVTVVSSRFSSRAICELLPSSFSKSSRSSSIV
ncbi:hypothetical protein KC338_g276 [Hortaea werneckii]|nr:hypothetical protein KC338_g276 [Hortaea werneckii]